MSINDNVRQQQQQKTAKRILIISIKENQFIYEKNDYIWPLEF